MSEAPALSPSQFANEDDYLKFVVALNAAESHGYRGWRDSNGADRSVVDGIASELTVVTVEHPDPRGAHLPTLPERVVRVSDGKGGIRTFRDLTNQRGGDDPPMTVNRLIEEVCNENLPGSKDPRWIAWGRWIGGPVPVFG